MFNCYLIHSDAATLEVTVYGFRVTIEFSINEFSLRVFFQDI